MTLRSRTLSLRHAAAITVGAAVFLTRLASSQAQQSAPGTAQAETAADAFSFEIGHSTHGNAVYAIEATQPATSKLTGQKVRLKTVEVTGFDRTTHYFTLATGKHKTVAQLNTLLADIFRRFLATPPPAPNTELGKIGDLRYGGEVRFVAESADRLRFDSLTPSAPVRPSQFSRADIEALLAILTSAPSA